ncbi:MAG: glycosyltransferase family 2 protein [Bacteroidota bacterium]
MKLSVVIVNYNVKYFLEQALHSVRKAIVGIDAEVFVVDNHSVDGSCEMVKRKFPEVVLIENKENCGFSKANNQAIKQSKGEYILLLNPDTVVEEDCFSKIISFMNNTPDAGALGVKMIDGKGHYLPESKRGLPTPTVAFYKMFGLANLFPKSKRFGQYHLAFLDKNKTHQVDVLAGAFMLLRKSVLDKIGLLDEEYFMYGEDIDLSYRITKAGYKNYYFPETTIIHYKGESTKKTSVNYVFIFYRAMITFAQKHYTHKLAQSFSLIINIAIYIRAAISISMRVVQKFYLPFLDFIFMYAAMFLVKEYWTHNVKDVSGQYYPSTFMTVNSLIYSLCWIVGLYISEAYEKSRSILRVINGILLGSVIISVGYAFAPESYRFSRALILLGSASALIVSYLNRLLVYTYRYKKFNPAMQTDTKTIIIGNKKEVSRVLDLLVKSKANCDYAGYLNINIEEENDDHFLGNVKDLHEIVEFFSVEEIIFCSKDMSAQQIIQWMGNITKPSIQFKIVPEESLFIIGSNSKNAPGDFYTLEINLSLNTPLQIKKKRLFDVAVSLLLIPVSPLLLLFVNKRLNYLSNIIKVLFGEKTWVGYAITDNYKMLPKIKTGVLSPVDSFGKKNINNVTAEKLNFLYAKDYSMEKDLLILLGGLSRLGN